MAISIGEGKLWIQTNQTPLKIDLVLHPARAKWLGIWIYMYIYIYKQTNKQTKTFVNVIAYFLLIKLDI